MLPNRHNVHMVEALEPCAFLDIISPPYSDDRRCTYYSAAAASDPGIAQLSVCAAVPPFIGPFERAFSWTGRDE